MEQVFWSSAVGHIVGRQYLGFLDYVWWGLNCLDNQYKLNSYDIEKLSNHFGHVYFLEVCHLTNYEW